MSRARVLHWNGKDLPEELRELPAGTYVIEALEEAPSLTTDEEIGIGESLESLRAGHGSTTEQVAERIDSVLRK